MENLKKVLLLEAERVEEILKKSEEEMKRLPQGKIRVCRRNQQYYMYDMTQDHEKGVYIKCRDREKAIPIIQGEYCQKIINKLRKRKKLISQLLNSIDDTDPGQIYENCPKAKKNFIHPYELDNQTLILKWENEEYEGKQFPEGFPKIYTERGERVRSKTEKIIADKLFKENIPYRYEYPTKLRGYGIVYPDFTILGVHSRQNIILEHFGMMDDLEYLDMAINKIRQYQLDGYIMGKTFFMTMESSGIPFDSRVLDGIIKQLKEL